MAYGAPVEHSGRKAAVGGQGSSPRSLNSCGEGRGAAWQDTLLRFAPGVFEQGRGGGFKLRAGLASSPSRAGTVEAIEAS